MAVPRPDSSALGMLLSMDLATQKEDTRHRCKIIKVDLRWYAPQNAWPGWADAGLERIYRVSMVPERRRASGGHPTENLPSAFLRRAPSVPAVMLCSFSYRKPN